MATELETLRDLRLQSEEDDIDDGIDDGDDENEDEEANQNEEQYGETEDSEESYE